MTEDRHICVLLFTAISLVQLWSSRKPRMHATLLRQAGMICSLEMHQAGVKPQHGGSLSPGSLPADPPPSATLRFPSACSSHPLPVCSQFWPLYLH